jgi:hypothetical protein
VAPTCTVGIVKLDRPSRNPQGDQHHAGVARLDHDEALTPAEGNAANADFPGIGHRSPDHAKNLNGDRPVRIDVTGGAEINRVDLGARHEGFQIDRFPAGFCGP